MSLQASPTGHSRCRSPDEHQVRQRAGACIHIFHTHKVYSIGRHVRITGSIREQREIKHAWDLPARAFFFWHDISKPHRSLEDVCTTLLNYL
jgi:hypothetical protein